MDIKEPQTYSITSSFQKVTVLCKWVFLGFVLLFIAIPFFPDVSNTKNQYGVYALSIIGTIFFGLLSFYASKTIKRFSSNSVTIDKDGIWPSHRQKKEALVPWASIANIKERPFLQRLELIGQDGLTLLRIEYQLSDFDKLRNLLIDRIDIKRYQCLPLIFSKKSIYHFFYFSCVFGFSWLGWYVGQKNPLLGYGGTAFLVIAICYEYFFTVWRLSLDHHKWTVHYPISARSIEYNAINKVKLSDTIVKGARHPEVHIMLKDATKPIKLKALGIDAVLLYKILKRIVAENRI